VNIKVLAVIPSRMASTRLPEKPLHMINGKPMIQWVYEGTTKSSLLSRTIVATDDQRIIDCVQGFGGEAMLTSLSHKTGTDRICEVVEKIGDGYDMIVNVQGDEPLIRGSDLDRVIRPMLDDPELVMATPIAKAVEDDSTNPNTVKVVVAQNGKAMYFSRAAIPFIRGEAPVVYKHIGIYVFRKEFLLHYRTWAQTPCEKSEMLEQLRVLENGYAIQTVVWETLLHAVDTPDDVREVERIMKGEGR